MRLVQEGKKGLITAFTLETARIAGIGLLAVILVQNSLWSDHAHSVGVLVTALAGAFYICRLKIDLSTTESRLEQREFVLMRIHDERVLGRKEKL